MSHVDLEIKDIFSRNELEMTDRIVSSLEKNGFVISNINEKVHIMIGLVDNFCHEVVYHRHSNMNYDIMKKQIIDVILYMIIEEK